MNCHLKKNFTVIVSVVVIENHKLLMMQEAKPECFGLWYLPAGRLERHENLVEGARRECKEETELEVDIITILSVELRKLKWIRFNFIGKIIGGKLKTSPDKESLSADWVPVEVVLAGGNDHWRLRSTDIISVVKSMVGRADRGLNILPVSIKHSAIEFQLYIFSVSNGQDQQSMLIDRTTNSVPIIVIADLNKSFYEALNLFWRRTFPSVVSTYKNELLGILSIEFNGTDRATATNSDGIRIALLVPNIMSTESLIPEAGMQWWPVAELSSRLVNESDRRCVDITTMAVAADKRHLPVLEVLRG